MASGYASNESGMTIINSGQGVFQIGIRSVDSSGLDFGNYAYTIERMDSGNRTLLTDGFWMLGTNGTV